MWDYFRLVIKAMWDLPYLLFVNYLRVFIIIRCTAFIRGILMINVN